MNSLKIVVLYICLLFVSFVLSSELVIEEGLPIPNLGNTNKQQKHDVTKAAEKLDYASLFINKQQVIAQFGSIHIDMQGTFTEPNGDKYHNIQAQLTSSPTVAHVNLNENVMTDNKSNQKGIRRKVVSALLKSLDTGKTYKVYAKSKEDKKNKNKDKKKHN